MELLTPTKPQTISSGQAFIEANTIASTLATIKQEHIIPVFVRDNTTVIAHSEFIEATMEAVAKAYPNEMILQPNIRLSHVVKGRTPEAKNKAADELLEHERTIYYERMGFLLEIPTIQSEVAGSRLTLSVGGVKAYNLDNLNTKSGADQHFKIFAGFKNTVCTNMCLNSDGYVADLKVKDVGELYDAILNLLQDYDAVNHTKQMQQFSNYELSDEQFAHLVGKCRMYRYLPESEKALIPELQFGDTQINTVCRDYYADKSFCRNEKGAINLWNLYNLFTESNKSSYIDSFLDRSVNAHSLVSTLQEAMIYKKENWFLN